MKDYVWVKIMNNFAITLPIVGSGRLAAAWESGIEKHYEL